VLVAAGCVRGALFDEAAAAFDAGFARHSRSEQQFMHPARKPFVDASKLLGGEAT
jgi:hypothetical protein